MSSTPIAPVGDGPTHTSAPNFSCTHIMGSDPCRRRVSKKCNTAKCAAHCKLASSPCAEHPVKSNPISIPFGTVANTVLPLPPTIQSDAADGAEQLDPETAFEVSMDQYADDDDNRSPTFGTFSTNAAAGSSSTAYTTNSTVPPALFAVKHFGRVE
ncbi:hypothetical protein FIBSPDRAFT_309573 [Athelia psychrophila]|uniref:Uncharacterized protein n=1 Tax=Athelia psychrophila TaxID=1759441 RepID=A0A166WA47_9AGAM|nr:hypothetical protein FIBSPDRAFT_309573 [Fibularhizoctonia sp. CBS 109695]